MPRTMELALLGNRTLQILVRGNFVCFPSQAPIFGQKSRRDLQWRLAVLYFVRGWSTRAIADRYGLTRERCGQIISDWRIRAVALGYIQDVTPEGTDLSRLAESHAVTPFGKRQSGGGGTSQQMPEDISQARGLGNSVQAANVLRTSEPPANVVPSSDAMSQTPFAISATPRLPSILR